jgi:hypothetical protein
MSCVCRADPVDANKLDVSQANWDMSGLIAS